MRRITRLPIFFIFLLATQNTFACWLGPSPKMRTVSVATSIFVAEFESFKFHETEDKYGRKGSYAEIQAKVLETVHGKHLDENVTIYYNYGHFSLPSKHLVEQHKFIVAVTTLPDVIERSHRWSESIGAALENENSLWVIQEFCSLPYMRSHSEENRNKFLNLIDLDMEKINEFEND